MLEKLRGADKTDFIVKSTRKKFTYDVIYILYSALVQSDGTMLERNSHWPLVTANKTYKFQPTT